MVIPRGSGFPDYRTRLAGTTPVSLEGGTLGHVGTLRYVQAGSLGRVTSVGSLGHLQGGSLGGVGRVENLVAVGTIKRLESIGTISSRGTIGTRLFSAQPLAVGSIGSSAWVDVGRFNVKTLGILSTQGGSHFLMAGVMGTNNFRGPAGTYATRRIGAGTLVVISLTENLQYLRSMVFMGSSAFDGAVARGTVTVTLRGQA